MSYINIPHRDSIPDNNKLYFGTSEDFYFIYDETTDNALELWTSDSDGAGTDAELLSIASGGTTVTLNGTLDIDSNALLSGGGADGKLILSNLAGSQGVLFDTSTDGQLTLTDESSGALNLRIDGRIFDGAGPLNLGTAAATSRGLTTGDVLIGGKLEVDGSCYFDGNIIMANEKLFQSPNVMSFYPNLSKGQLLWLTGSQVGYTTTFAGDYWSRDFNVPAQTVPTIAVVDNTDPDTLDSPNIAMLQWNRLALGGNGGGYGCVNQTVSYSDLVDGGGVVGTLVLDEGIPDGAVVSRCILHTLTGFTGGANSTAVITVGDGTDVDRYNTGTPDVYTTNASGVDMGDPSGTKFHDDAKNVTLTVTVDSDFSAVSAGSFKIALFYFTP